MTLHERTHTGYRPYECQTCKKNFALKQNYLNHIKTHQAKIIVCKSCGATFKSSLMLRRHEEKEHSEEFPLKCVCGKIFKTENAFDLHDKKCGIKIKFDGSVTHEEFH